MTPSHVKADTDADLLIELLGDMIDPSKEYRITIKIPKSTQTVYQNDVDYDLTSDADNFIVSYTTSILSKTLKIKNPASSKTNEQIEIKFEFK